jgi:cytochrome c oxidase subunit 4
MTLAEYREKRGEPLHTEEHAEEHTEKHPGVLEYTQIGLILFAITAIEVGIYYVGLSFTALVVSLLVLSLIKFTLVVLWFMHLRFDNRLFSTMFVMGLVTAVTVFTVVISVLHGQLV